MNIFYEAYRKMIFKLFYFFRNKAQKACEKEEHEYTFKSYAWCKKCDKRKPNWEIDWRKQK